MSRIKNLVIGDLQRLAKYNMIAANTVVLVFWVIIAWFIDASSLVAFIPFIFLMDAVMMNMLLNGAVIFYEKKEHTVNSILVSPVTEEEYIAAKMVSTVINSMFTIIFISLAMWLLRGITFNYFALVPAIIVVSCFHTLLGIYFTYGAKDFTNMLVTFVVYVLITMLPSVLGSVGFISEEISRWLIILPPDASSLIITASIKEVELWKLIFSYAYLPLLSFAVYKFLVKPGFNQRIAVESGV